MDTRESDQRLTPGQLQERMPKMQCHELDCLPVLLSQPPPSPAENWGLLFMLCPLPSTVISNHDLFPCCSLLPGPHERNASWHSPHPASHIVNSPLSFSPPSRPVGSRYPFFRIRPRLPLAFFWNSLALKAVTLHSFTYSLFRLCLCQ